MPEKPQKSNIHPHDIEPLLVEVIHLRDQGKLWSEILPQVKGYWARKPPVDGAELSSKISGIAKRGNCPLFFKEWWDGRNQKIKTVKAATKTKTVKGHRPEKMISEDIVRIREKNAASQMAEEIQDVLTRIRHLSEATPIGPETVISILENHLSSHID